MAKSSFIIAGVWVILLGIVLGAGPASGQSADTAQISLNKASAAQLSKVRGITSSLAKAIVDYRQKNGPFKKVEDLAKVPGMTKDIMKRANVQDNGKGDLTVSAPKSGDQDEEEPSLKPSKC